MVVLVAPRPELLLYNCILYKAQLVFKPSEQTCTCCVWFEDLQEYYFLVVPCFGVVLQSSQSLALQPGTEKQKLFLLSSSKPWSEMSFAHYPAHCFACPCSVEKPLKAGHSPSADHCHPELCTLHKGGGDKQPRQWCWYLDVWRPANNIIISALQLSIITHN